MPIAMGTSRARSLTTTIMRAIASAINRITKGDEGKRDTESNPRMARLEPYLSLSQQQRQKHFYRFGAIGSPDIVCAINGQFVRIEVKAPIGKQSENQKEFQAQLEAAGGKYILAYSIDDVERGLNVAARPPGSYLSRR